MGTPVDDGILHDQIKTLVRRPKIAPPVIDNDLHLGLFQQAGEDGLAADHVDETGIDFHHRDGFHVRVVGQDLDPGARTEADEQNIFWVWMEGGRQLGARDPIGILARQRADIEAALVGAAAVEIAAAGYGNDTAVRLDHRRQWTPAPKIAA